MTISAAETLEPSSFDSSLVEAPDELEFELMHAVRLDAQSAAATNAVIIFLIFIVIPFSYCSAVPAVSASLLS